MSMEEWLRRYPPGKEDLDNQDETDFSKTVDINRRKLKKQAPQETLDLHGLTVDEAHTAVNNFLEEASEKELKKVLIIHGKGIHSEGEAVLRKEVFKLLEKSPLAGEFGAANRHSGGSGAVWVILKRPEPTAP